MSMSDLCWWLLIFVVALVFCGGCFLVNTRTSDPDFECASFALGILAAGVVFGSVIKVIKILLCLLDQN